MKTKSLLLFGIIISLGFAIKPDLPTSLPEKIKDLPLGILVKHNLDSVWASFNKEPERGLKYKWYYETTVSAIHKDLKIIEFGGYNFVNGIWIEKNLEGKPFTNEDFEKWYKCNAGNLIVNKSYTDINNWSTSNFIDGMANKSLWYFIGEDSNKIKFVEYAKIISMPKMKK